MKCVHDFVQAVTLAQNYEHTQIKKIKPELNFRPLWKIMRKECPKHLAKISLFLLHPAKVIETKLVKYFPTIEHVEQVDHSK